MDSKAIAIDLNATLAPNMSAAGITLGQYVSDVNDIVSPAVKERRAGCLVLKYESVWIYITDNIIDQICVLPGYQGKLQEGIGIGSTAREVEDLLGPIVDNDGAGLSIDTISGFCFEVGDACLDIRSPEWYKSKINFICIFQEN
jgi:hypothetical protein